MTTSFHLSTNCVRNEVGGLRLGDLLLKEALEDAGDLQVTHLVGDREKTWHQRFRFTEAKCRGHRFPLSSVDVPLGPCYTPVEHGGGELATGGGFHPSITGVEDMEDSLGVCGPQTVFLFKASPVKTPIEGERMFGFLRIHVPREPPSNVRCCRMWPNNGSRARLLRHPAKSADSLQYPTFPCIG